ncbi:MAG TPA: ATP synthase F1 subunit gamma [Bacteroidetes bacterium]|nr:ATP synthase F1 subunit gamma [Bacteroidota bacterium]
MATLRDIRRRINSVRSTQQITKAMKMVAAARLRRAQENILRARPYAYELREVIGHVVGLVDRSLHPLLEEREVHRVGLVVVTADRGLCGAFNMNIIRRTMQEIGELQEQGKELELILVGRKSRDFFRRRDYPIISEYYDFFNNLNFSHAQRIGQQIIQLYNERHLDQITVIYNEFKSAIQQRIVAEQLLPMKPHMPEEVTGTVEYIYEPSPDALLEVLLPRQINIQMWRILLESNAAEQGARMTAMEMATENAEEMIQKLTLYYNRVRQATITKEIIEIVSGAEALKS